MCTDGRHDDFEGATIALDDFPLRDVRTGDVRATEKVYRAEPVPKECGGAAYEDGACYVWEGERMRRAASVDHLRALPKMYHAGDVLRVVAAPDGPVTEHVDMGRAELCASKARDATDALLGDLLAGAPDMRLVRAVVEYVADNAGRALASMLGEAAR